MKICFKIVICSFSLLFYLSAHGQIPFTLYENNLFAAKLLDKEPIPGKTEDERRNERLGTTELIFSNGITITLKPTTGKKDEILMDGWRVGGSHKFRLVDKQNARYAADIVRQMGVSKFSPADLKKLLTGKKFSVLPYINEHEEGVEGSSSVKDFEIFLQLVYLYFTEPRKDSALFRSYITRQKKSAEPKDDPESYFRDTIWKVAYNNNPWVRSAPTAADYDKIDIDKSFRIYKQVFGNAYGMHFTFVGKLDDPNIIPLLEKYIASLPSEPKEIMPKDNGIRLAKDSRTIIIQKGIDPQSCISLMFEGDAEDNQEEKLKLAALMEVTNIILFDKLHEILDSNYAGGLYGSIANRPYIHYSVYGNFPCEPGSVVNLMDSIVTTIKYIQQNGVDKKLFEKVKETWKKKYRVGLPGNSFWLGSLTNSWINEEDPEDILDYENTLNILTVKDIQEAANQFLQLDKMVKAFLFPQNVRIPDELKKAF